MRIPTLLRASTVLALSAALIGCAGSSPPNFYTLVPDTDPAPAAASAALAGAAIQLMPVTLPPQMDQPQIMLRAGDDQLSPLYGERWAAPLGDELQTALSRALTRRLGIPDLAALGASAGMTIWRIQTDVQGFEMPAAGPALLDATWRLRQGGEPALVCRTQIRQLPEGPGATPLVEAQQRAVVGLAEVMARAIETGGAPPVVDDDARLLGCSRTQARSG